MTLRVPRRAAALGDPAVPPRARGSFVARGIWRCWLAAHRGASDHLTDRPLAMFVVAASASTRERMRRLLTGAGVRVVGEGASADATVSAADADVILVADADLLERRPAEDGEWHAPVVVLSDDRATAAALMAMAPGGWALLPHEATGEEVRSAGLLAAAGLVVLPPTAVRPAGALAAPTPDFGEDDGLPASESLTHREREVLERLADGKSNKEIGVALGMSEHTAKFHVASVLAKLGAANRAEAVRRGLRRGELTL